jgi:hypothetical protein
VRWKREAFEQSLADYYEVKVVFVDHQALVVPESARPNPGGDEILRMIGGVDAEFLAGKMQSLAYGLNMAKPIEDLQVDDTGIHATLSFGGLGWHKTFVPWEAVLGLRCEGPRPKAKPQLRSV